MSYKYGDKFVLSNIKLDFEILGVYPGGQHRAVVIKENTYLVNINGAVMEIPESNLNILKESQVKQEELKKTRFKKAEEYKK